MQKYKNYLENKFDKWQIVIAVLCAVAMAGLIIVEMAMPVDSKELENHYATLEVIKQDITKICELENAEINIEPDGVTITLKGKSHNLNASFDDNNNYLNATIVDNRIGANVVVSILLVIAFAGIGYMLSCAILILLLIPVLVHAVIMYVKKKKTISNKQKK